MEPRQGRWAQSGIVDGLQFESRVDPDRLQH
ncbi:hypothetical protein P308_12455 [Pseudomonas piscis]|nr:hypothetical protein P308_12455 [Pseudomonas piscis]